MADKINKNLSKYLSREIEKERKAGGGTGRMHWAEALGGGSGAEAAVGINK